MFVRVVSVVGKALILALAIGVLNTAPASAIEVGILKCRFNGVDAAVHFGAKRQLDCVFKQKRRKRQHRYVAMIEKYGIEVGIIGSSQMVWRVTSKTGNRLRRGALAGTYRGITVGASVGSGFAANILTGGRGRSYSLHPLAFQKVKGLNVAAGLLVMRLKRAR